MNNETNTELIPLSTLLHTDCYIDCGSNERLREVVGVIESKGIKETQNRIGIGKRELYMCLSHNAYYTLTIRLRDLPTHHINQINLEL